MTEDEATFSARFSRFVSFVYPSDYSNGETSNKEMGETIAAVKQEEGEYLSSADWNILRTGGLSDTMEALLLRFGNLQQHLPNWLEPLDCYLFVSFVGALLMCCYLLYRWIMHRRKDETSTGELSCGDGPSSSRRQLSSPDKLSRMQTPHRSGGIGRSVATARHRSSTFDFFGTNQAVEEDATGRRYNRNPRLGATPNRPQRKRTGSFDIDFLFRGLSGYGDNDDSNNKMFGRDPPLSTRSGGDDSFRLSSQFAYSHDEEGMLYDEFGIITLSSHVTYHGPTCSSVSYSTWTPPMTVARKRSKRDGGGIAPPTPAGKAHGRLLASDILLKLQRQVVMDINKATLALLVQDSSSSTPAATAGTKSSSSSSKFDFSFPIQQFSTHVVPPTEGGVLNLYLLGSSKEEWMEFTFETASKAAQFQLDMISYQVLGKTLKNMYQVLSLIHQGSAAHEGQEFVLHDDRQSDNDDGTSKAAEGRIPGETGGGTGVEIKSKEEGDDASTRKDSPFGVSPTYVSAGVAWDDAMRALSSIPSVRIALERLWLHHRNHGFPATASQVETNHSASNSGATVRSQGLGTSSSRKKKRRFSKNLANTSNDGTGPMKTGSSLETSPSAIDVHQASLTEEYVNKRLLLGPVDFFRLFVPTLPETAVPQTNETNKERMDQLLRWRKRVARAAVLVRGYALSHRVVNEGWTLPLPPTFQMPPHLRPFRRRLAYDDNEDNIKRDSNSQNEYYEATVSRDVFCYVRPDTYFSSDNRTGDQPVNNGSVDSATRSFAQRALVLSPCQAFSLVAAHIFELPEASPGEDPASHPLHPSRDPVAIIPSLHNLITSHPEVDFFVSAFYPAGRRVAVVVCYVRSLPKGVDIAFDNVMDRFVNGDKETRDRKLHIMIQLGPYVGLSLAGWTILRVLSFLLSLTKKGRESQAGYETTRDRSPFPALRLMNYAETRHFGGRLQTDPSMPKNYVAVNSSYDSMHMPNFLARLLFWRLENGSLRHSIMDFTFILEGEQEDELPERALSTIRMTHVESDDVALPISISAAWKSRCQDDVEPTPEADHGLSGRLSTLVSQKFQDMVSIMGSPLRYNSASRLPPEATLGVLSEEEDLEEEDYNDGLNFVESDDPMEIAANIIADLLANAFVPVRKDQLGRSQVSSAIDQSMDDADASKSSSILHFQSHKDTSLVSVLSRITREDMKRFWVASNFDPKVSSIRLVETSAWRGITFPIDKRRCRVELQSGQFFQQGRDLMGNPVFYFRNMCLGPWRGDVDAAISAVLYRLEKSLSILTRTEPGIKLLLIVLMGRPYEKQKGKHSVDNLDDSAASHDEELSTAATWISNPRIDHSETWQVHTNREMIGGLIATLTRHYPERLSRALVFNGKGANSYYNGSSISGRMALGAVMDSKQTKAKVKFLKNSSDLLQYVSESELVTIVGGKAPIHSSVYECR